MNYFSCVGEFCKDGKSHAWDGPELTGKTANEGSFSSATCSKCGLDAISWSLMLDTSKLAYDHLLEDDLDEE